ncbi:MAG: hypothetical protein H8F28_00540 [Fibrella sp.]|nr:hypothetical protein [Armatimonadota bacterium]
MRGLPLVSVSLWDGRLERRPPCRIKVRRTGYLLVLGTEKNMGPAPENKTLASISPSLWLAVLARQL